MKLTWMAVACCLFAMPATVLAQDEEPGFDQLVATFQRPYLTIGTLMQAVADFQIERTVVGSNGFLLGNARLRLSGELDNGFGYLFQTNFTDGPAILDAQIKYRFSGTVAMSAGQFKAPFSYEFLTYGGSIDFVNRATMVTALAPGRQVGADVTLGRNDGPATLTAGIFNGNRIFTSGNDGNGMMVAARAAGRPIRADGDGSPELLVGANIAFSRDSDVLIPGVSTSFAGDRTLVGADARLTIDRLVVSGEFIYAHLETTAGATTEPWGFHTTAGYMLTPKMQALVRWDQLRSVTNPTSHVLLLGYNVWPTKATEIQVNYLIDTDDATFDHHQLLVNFQLGF
ncbi:MAG: OprO/OprP family phosphate-selective porin [Gemmatimonadota bacterium]|nr:OprO/OprP family phosphate-selective porin [Gemmatimonadota bacterium]